MSLIDNEPHSATVRAEVQTDMLIPAAPSSRAACPRTRLSVRDHARPGAAAAQRRPADRVVALLDVYGRVARSCSTSPGRERVVKISNKLPRQEIAKVVGASREMVTRVMKGLEEPGHVQMPENGKIIIAKR